MFAGLGSIVVRSLLTMRDVAGSNPGFVMDVCHLLFSSHLYIFFVVFGESWECTGPLTTKLQSFNPIHYLLIYPLHYLLTSHY